MAVVLGILVGLVISWSKKYCLPRCIKYLKLKADKQKQGIVITDHQRRERIGNENEIFTVMDLKNYLDQQVFKQNLQLEAISKKMNEPSEPV